MDLTMNVDEFEFLLHLLETRHGELVREIAHTENHEFRQGLRRNEKLLETLIGRLRAAAVLQTYR